MLCYSQTDLSILSDTIDISQTKLLGESWSQVNKQASLAEALQRNTSLNYKNYGPGSIATLSLRGTSASHANVIWNNVPIENTMVGQMDFSLIPSYFIDEYKITLNNIESHNYPSLGIGGNVMFASKHNKTNSGWSINSLTERSSFNNYVQAASIQYSNTKWYFKQQAYFQDAQNNYPYTIEGTDSTAYLNHNHFSQQASLTELSYTANEKLNVKADVWFQQAERQLPPTSVQGVSLSSQSDDIIRATLNYKGLFKHWQVNQTIALTDEKIRFLDPINIVDNTSNFSRLFASNQLKWFGRFFDVFVNQSIALHKANIEKYENEIQEMRYSLNVGISKQWNKLGVKIQGIKNHNNQLKLPLSGSANIAYYLLSDISLNLEQSWRIREPSFNDLYWFPGGNPDLKAEKSRHSELSIAIVKPTSQFRISAYYKDTEDWILWYRPNQSFFWIPENIQEVTSRGLEFSHKLNLNVFTLSSEYTYTQSTFTKATQSPVITEGSQLWYIPKHAANIGLTGNLHQLGYGINHLFRSSSTGINKSIKAYHLTDIYLKYSYQLSKLSTTIKLTCNNLFDSQYEVIEFRPMPGRNYGISINLNL